MAASNEARAFEDRPAVRGAMPLLFGLVGPSSSGKTYSGLRIATGMQRVVGGEIWVIDTESNRALHYADRFKFRHVPFAAPFSPLDYLDAIEHCVRKGARIVMVDSMSHEHEGPGGVLEWHEAEVERLSKGDPDKAERMKMLAWQKPKAARRRLINTILQLNVNLICCFRAKEKIKIVKGKDPEQLGFMPIAGDEFVYELTGKALLLPGANGVPTWQSENVGERLMIKLPEQFRGIFDGSKPTQLDELVGAQLAQWAAGGSPVTITADEYAKASTQAEFHALEQRRAQAWPTTRAADKPAIKTASEAAQKRIAAAPATPKAEASTRELKLDGNPPTGEAEALAALEAAYKKGEKQLAAAWARIQGEYSARGEDIPLAVDAKFGELNEALKE